MKGTIRKGAPATTLALIALALAGCARETPVSPAEVSAVSRPSLPADPFDPAWETAPVHVAPLILQDMVEPRLLEPSTREVRVRAITDGTGIAFRLDWSDAVNDDLPGAARFSDACAIQLPSGTGPDVPAPQMGETGRGVEITYWRAEWQAVVDGRGDTIRDLYPNATVDHYPFEAASLTAGSAEQREMEQRYAPARALGNALAGPREKPVQDLVAEGPGTLAPGPSTGSAGRGARTAEGWSVVVSRRLPEGLSAGGQSQVAFAVWEGGREEVGSRKMRTGWVPLALEAGS
jgi:DMSO reductase family type II enzyme heme b subunit